jgi:DNA replication and repair protein RecF
MRGTSGVRVEGWFVDRCGREQIDWSIRPGRGMERTPVLPAGHHPVRLICEATQTLIEGEPSVRRRFLDWNLRLWDPEAPILFSRFRRIAAQRNAWLRSGAKGRAVWDASYAAALSGIFALRLRLLAKLQESLQGLARESGWFQDVTLVWEGPKADEEQLLGQLERMRAADRERGFTYLGDSRCDVVFKAQGERWTGSRGQCKVLGILLQIASERIVVSQSGVSSIWLVDDLDAELAPDWTAQLLTILRAEGEQLLITSLPGKATLANARVAEEQMFHVEQGTLAARSGSPLMP